MAHIAHLLKLYREERNLTQGELGQILGVSRASINNYEGGHGIPTGKVYERIEALVKEETTERATNILEGLSAKQLKIIEALAHALRTS